MIIKKLEKFFESKKESKVGKLKDLVEQTESLNHEDSIIQILEDLDLPNSFEIVKDRYIIMNIVDEYVVDGPTDNGDVIWGKDEDQKIFRCITIEYDDEEDADLVQGRHIESDEDRIQIDGNYIQRRLGKLNPERDILNSFIRMMKICPDILIEISDGAHIQRTIGYHIIFM